MKNKDTAVDREDKKDAARIRVAVYGYTSEETDVPAKQFGKLGRIYIESFKRNPSWSLMGIYAENPVHSVRKKRPQFLRLMKDCDNSLVDCILCRSIPMFIRNDRKELQSIRHLLEMGIHLIFENDKIESDSDLFRQLLTVLEAIADGKSQAFSESNATIKRRTALNGATPFSGLYGYSCFEKGSAIVQEEAEIVMMVFDYYEHGMIVERIAEILTDKEIPTPRGQGARWSSATIRAMIENEKYAGDYDALRIVVSRQPKAGGENRIKSTVYHKDNHPAIIPREQFERCGMIANLRKTSTPLQYPFGEYLRCPYCGQVLFRRKSSWKNIYCCEGEGACRKFVIKAYLVEEAILDAYENIDMKAVQKIAGKTDYKTALAATQLLRIKQDYPAFEKIDYWWLDELIERISFGQHRRTTSELKKMGDKAAAMDDRTINIYWRCDLVSTVPSGVKSDYYAPEKRAERWDNYVLSHPDKYPKLVQEIQKNSEITPGSQ